MSKEIKIVDAKKMYGSLTIIEKLNLKIQRGEFFTLLGPSGCGKTTLLRMIAGFNTIEGGTFHFDDLLINDVDANKRNIGMVFQNYAIFPHLTVKENVMFGLKNRKLDKETIEKEANTFLNLMKIYEYKDRMPERLSGGQQQRVALARALAIKPDVLLMDEPLSNLDAKLRIEMRQAIRDIQKEVGITTVYVTHDQEEAMAISDRIAVMNDGEIQQIGTPQEIYHRPNNLFVASFIGRTNILNATYNKSTKKVSILDYTFNYLNEIDENISVSIRPEEFIFSDSGLNGKIVDKIFLGLNTHFIVELDNKDVVEVISESLLNSPYKENDIVKLDVKIEKINIFSQDGLKNLVKAYGK